MTGEYFAGLQVASIVRVERRIAIGIVAPLRDAADAVGALHLAIACIERTKRLGILGIDRHLLAEATLFHQIWCLSPLFVSSPSNRFNVTINLPPLRVQRSRIALRTPSTALASQPRTRQLN